MDRIGDGCSWTSLQEIIIPILPEPRNCTESIDRLRLCRESQHTSSFRMRGYRLFNSKQESRYRTDMNVGEVEIIAMIRAFVNRFLPVVDLSKCQEDFSMRQIARQDH